MDAPWKGHPANDDITYCEKKDDCLMWDETCLGEWAFEDCKIWRLDNEPKRIA